MNEQGVRDVAAESIALKKRFFDENARLLMEVGGRMAYYFPIDRGRIFLGAGIGLFQRWYDEKIDNVFNFPADKDRRDFYVEPTAHLILPNLIAPNVDLRFDYRFEGNYSNDVTRDYENHVAGTRVVGRF